MQAADFARVIAAAYRETYLMFAKFQVAWMHCPLLADGADHAADGAAAAAGDAAGCTSAKRPLVWGRLMPEKDRLDRHLPRPDGTPVRCSLLTRWRARHADPCLPKFGAVSSGMRQLSRGTLHRAMVRFAASMLAK